MTKVVAIHRDVRPCIACVNCKIGISINDGSIGHDHCSLFALPTRDMRARGGRCGVRGLSFVGRIRPLFNITYRSVKK